MEDRMSGADISSNNLVVREIEDDEVEEEFRSCCGEDNSELKERDESLKQDSCDESTVKMYFKGISIDGFGESGSGFTGIGVVIEGPSSFPVTNVQKRLEFFVEASVANYLALIDGLLEVLKASTARNVFAFSDSKILCQQIMFEVSYDMPLLVALRERVHELVGQLDAFCLKLVPSAEAERPLQLARVAIGLVTLPEQGHESLETCTICCDDKPPSMMLTLRCSHKFCSQCLKTYANGKVEVGQVPVRCPQTRCKYILSTSECKLFLPVISYEILEKAVEEFNVIGSEKFYCPYQNCLALLDPYECLKGETNLDESSDGCIECPVCQRSICMYCGVPQHNSLSCREYQDLRLDERDPSDLSLHCLAQDRRWRRCQLCRRMIELEQGCYNVTCWCGHEFCFFCGTEYMDRQQTCQCAFWDEGHSVDSVTPEANHWGWNSFDANPMILDAYSDQERSQLAIIQRFLAGGFNLSDDHSCQVPPPCTDSYIDSMKDLHQLPWLERFVSVISDNYYEDYIH